MTLVELLVVVAIIAVLIALLLPAVQSVREAARITQCNGNLKQLGLAALQHERSHSHFPTGGWGYQWVGDPDRGFGTEQPGGVLYNLLPFLEQTTIHDMGVGLGNGTPSNAKGAAAREMIKSPVPTMSCPTRRAPQAGPFLHLGPGGMMNIAWAASEPNKTCFRADYVANAGSIMILWGDGPNYFLAPRQIYKPNIITQCNGLSYSQSQVRAAHVVDGASNTYYAGEKHVNPRLYMTGKCYNDDQPAYGADDMDLQAWTEDPPLQDDPTSGMTGNTTVFGSAHAAGIGMVFCDGAVRRIRYDVNPTLHSRLGNREDRKLVNLDDL